MSPKYGRVRCELLIHYYEAVQIKVVTSGWYIFSSSSRIGAFGYLYKDYFNPSESSEKLLSQNTASCSTNQFRLVFSLQSNITYVLVMTTVHPENTGSFTIYASGLDNVAFKRISK